MTECLTAKCLLFTTVPLIQNIKLFLRYDIWSVWLDWNITKLDIWGPKICSVYFRRKMLQFFFQTVESLEVIVKETHGGHLQLWLSPVATMGTDTSTKTKHIYSIFCPKTLISLSVHNDFFLTFLSGTWMDVSQPSNAYKQVYTHTVSFFM